MHHDGKRHHTLTAHISHTTQMEGNLCGYVEQDILWISLYHGQFVPSHTFAEGICLTGTIETVRYRHATTANSKDTWRS